MSLNRPAAHDREVPIAATARSSFAFVSSIAAVLVTGFAFSFLPFLLWWRSTGHFAYIADKDNQYFLQLASRLYYGNLLSMRDVVLMHATTAYQALQFVPAVMLTRILGLSVLEVNAIWHLWAAIALPLAFYVVFLHWLRRPWAAAFCAIVMLVDCGVLTVEPLFIQLMRLYQAAVGHLPIFYDGQDLHGQWRIVEPAIGMPVLLLQIFFVSSAVERPQDRKLLGAAGISTALLFYVWFYYWTAAVGALVIAFILDRPARRLYATILGVGLVAGLPAIVDGFTTRSLLSAEGLHRIGYFAPVPRLGFLLLPKFALIALLFTAVWIWRKPNKEGLYLWCLALAALLLSNNHIVTGMDLRAGHWRYVWGSGLSILVLVMAVQLLPDRFRASRWTAVMIASALLLIELAGGTALRVIEVDRSLNEKLVLNGYKKFESQGLRVPQLLPVNAVVAGDEEYSALASIVSGVRPLAGYAAFMGLAIGDREWESREALNAHLEGLSEQDFRSKARDGGRSYGWGESADPQSGARVEAGMMHEFAAMKNDPRPGIEMFGVNYVAIQVTRPDPDYLKRGWSLIEAGPYWRIWRKD
jgi:hypothetical protein